jgi:DNA repair/transcription protein MET18/MMS19
MSVLTILLVCKIDFVTGFIHAVDGERDPVNLLKLFHMVPKLANTSPAAVSSVSEELFEVISVYFPISFNPPADDPRGITSAQLTLGLQASLACHPSLASYVIPFLLEKLSSALIETKITTLEALAECVEQFGEVSTRMFVTEIWTYIRTEVLRSGNLDVIHSALEAIKIIAGTVCNTPNSTQNQTNMEGLIKPALTEVRSPESKFSTLYGRMLYSLCSAAPEICDAVCFRMLQELSVTLYEADTRDKKSGVLVMSTQLLEALNEQMKVKPLASIKYVSVLWDSVSSIINDKSLRGELIEVLSRFALFPDIVNNNILFNMIIEALLDEEKAVVTEAIKHVQWIYKFNESVVQDGILNRLLEDNYFENNFTSIVMVLTQIGSTCPNLSPYITERLFDGLSRKFHDIDISSRDVILATMNIVTDKANIQPKQSLQYLKTLIGLIVESYINNNHSPLLSSTVSLIGRLVQTLYRDLPVPEQQQLLDDLVSLVLESKVELFSVTAMPIDNFTPLEPTAEAYLDFIIVFSALFVATRQEVVVSNVKVLADRLSNLCIHTAVSEDVSQAAAQCLASIINKTSNINDETSVYILNDLIEGRIVKVAISSQAELYQRVKSVNALGWILNALTLRGAKWSGALSTVLFTLLNDPQQVVSRSAADAFNIIISDHELVLHKKTHAKVAVLYKQKFFSTNINGLLQSMNQAKEQQSANEGSILFAVAHLIHNVPKVIIIGEVERLFPLVLNILSTDTIDIDNKDLIIAALKTTETLLTEAKEPMTKYLSTITPILLKLSTEKLSMHIRVHALQCIAVLSSYPFQAIFPIKQAIINGLEKTLDDPKRNVRKLAVTVRNEWFVLSKMEQ